MGPGLLPVPPSWTALSTASSNKPACTSAFRTNAAVSVLLGERWKALPSSERAVYVEAAKKIKEDFKAEHPECAIPPLARTRGVAHAHAPSICRPPSWVAD